MHACTQCPKSLYHNYTRSSDLGIKNRLQVLSRIDSDEEE